MGRIVLSLLLWLLALLLLPVVGRAEGTEAAAGAGEDSAHSSPAYYDFTGDQSLYAERVAALNRGELPPAGEGLLSAQSVNEPGTQERGRTLTAVLCQTDGTRPDFTPWEPSYVLAGPYDCYTLYFPSEAAANRAAEGISALPGVRYAERDAEVEACEASTVTFRSWSARNMHYGPYLTWASGITEGSVTVAVVDSGVYPHEMYVDRMLASGPDYVDGDQDATNDPFGHGTNVTGILADCTRGFPVYIYPIRVLNASGSGSVSNTVNGIRNAVSQGVEVINMSLATKAGVSTALDQAVLDAVNAGVTVVAAAGNDTKETSTVSPAHLTDPGVLIIGAADTTGQIASYSNYGSSIDAYVYGTAISCCSNDGGYKNASGTSMSAPHMAGLASLLILTHEGITPTEIETWIHTTTDSDAEVRIPDLTRITPDNPGFSLTVLKMNKQDSYQLLTEIRPLAAQEAVSYTSSDETVVTVQDGLLTPHNPGTSTVTARCRGLEDLVFTVIVVDEEQSLCLQVPADLKSVGDEAFYDNDGVTRVVLTPGVESLGENVFGDCASLRSIEMPDSVTEIAENDFSGAVLLCPENSAAETYAINHHLAYILYGE